MSLNTDTYNTTICHRSAVNNTSVQPDTCYILTPTASYSFSALTLLVGWQKVHPASKSSATTIPISLLSGIDLAAKHICATDEYSSAQNASLQQNTILMIIFTTNTCISLIQRWSHSKRESTQEFTPLQKIFTFYFWLSIRTAYHDLDRHQNLIIHWTIPHSIQKSFIKIGS